MELQKIREFINNLEEKQFYQYTGIALATLVILMGIIVYYHRNNVHMLKKRVTRINISREVAQEILSRYKVVKKQKEEVDAILERESDFRIKNYFVTLLSTTGLARNLNQTEPIPSEQDLNETPGYTEVKLDALFRDLTMEQLCRLLQELEKNDKIYTKYLEINKSQSTQGLDVNLTIATLRKQQELLGERTE